MTIDLEQRLDAVCESLEIQKNEFEEGAKLCVEAMHVIHKRLERIEKWISEKEKRKAKLTKVPITDAMKKSPKKPLNPWKNP